MRSQWERKRRGAQNWEVAIVRVFIRRIILMKWFKKIGNVRLV